MELTIDQALQKAVEAHKAGKVQDADRLYTAILAVQPKHPDANHNLGVLAISVGKLQEALPFLKTALEANPSIAQFWLSYIDALIKLGRITDAKAVLDQAKRKGTKGVGLEKLERQLAGRGKDQEPPQQQVQNLIDLYTQGQYLQVLDKASQLLQQFPNSLNLHNIIGTTNKGLGRPDKAIEAYKKALAIKPNFSEAYNNMGVSLKEQGKLEEAIEAYKKALAIKPDYVEVHNNMGVSLKEQGKLDEAIEAYNKALTIKPDYVEALNNIGNVLQEQGKLEEAIEAYNKALTIKPDYAEAYNNMGVSLNEQGKLDEAIEAYNKALTIKPDYVEALNNMGNVLHEQGKLDEAIEAYKKALVIKPDFVEAYNNMGIAFNEQGKQDEAIEAYGKALTIKPDYAEAHRQLSIVTKYDSGAAQIDEVHALLQRIDLNDSDRCNLLYTHAKMQEDLGDFSAAFDSYVAGGTLRQKLLGYEFSHDEYLFDRIKQAAPQFKDLELKVTGEPIRHTPIFILGMPRSGTTLVEQIVSSHSDVTGAGELGYVSKFGRQLASGPKLPTLEAVAVFRDRYLLELAKRADGLAYITDKMPQNFGYIALICAAFPEAKIIHVRRNAAATCWSNFKHYFASKGLGYSYNLGDTVKYFGLYNDLMHFWYQSYYDRIYNFDYEKLTEDQEPETRRLIEYLGLNWEDPCLAPQENKRSVRTASNRQVRRNVYTGSSQAWRRYEPFLGDMFDEL